MGNFDDLYWGEWESGTDCSHDFAFKVVNRIRWEEIPMCSETQKTGLNIGRTVVGLLTLGLSEMVAGTVGDDITHEAIACRYRCNVCGHSGTYVFDYSDSGISIESSKLKILTFRSFSTH